MVEIGRYSGHGRGLSQVGADYFSGADTKGGALLQGIANAVLSGAGEGIDIIRDIYNTGNYAMGQIRKAPDVRDVVVGTAKYLASPSASAIEKQKSAIEEQKKQEELKLMRPFGLLQQFNPYSDDYYEYEAMSGDIQEQLNQLQNNLGKKTGKATIDTDTDTSTDKSTDTKLTMDDDETFGLGDTKADTTKSPLDKYTEDLVNETRDMYANLLAQDSDGKTKEQDIEKYKKEFYEATGIDPSGKPDMRGAMTAFGLALMQNKAGKGFNVGKILTSVGEAGEKALPLAEEARKEAKAGQLASGKYALEQIAKDKAQESALLKERRDAINAINTKNLDFAQQQQLEILKADLTRKEKALEYKNEIDKELIKAANEGLDLKGFDKMGVQGMEKTLYIQTAVDAKTSRQYVMNGKTAARNYAVAHGNVQQTMGLIDTLESIVNDMSDSEGGFMGSNAVGAILSKTQNQLKNIGLDIDLGQSFTDDQGNKYDGLTNTSKASALTDRILAESKRFLSKETGNGISEGDYQRLQKLVGDITSAILSAAEKKERLNQLRGIFDGRNAEIENGLKTLGDENMYSNKNVYNDVMSILTDSSVYQSTINFKDPIIGEDGLLQFDATK
tara:strand:- start:686 stop:2533 length:1848 start_codon:yes stop_codon:yes gene_type:complete